MAHFFDPDGLTSLGNLELIARFIVEGFLTGRHRSPFHGFSVEYLDHRPYTPGDELRALDWKILARTDKYHVKLFEDETNLRATIVLDCSASMAYRSGRLSKYDWGRYLAAALTYLLLQQNDAVGVVLFDQDIQVHLPPKAKRTQLRRVLELLEAPVAVRDTNVGGVLHRLAERLAKRGLVVLISDLLDDVELLITGLQHLRHDGHEVLVCHTCDNAELTFPFERTTQFKDCEGSAQLTANPASVRTTYLARMREFLASIEEACFERGIDYVRANTSEAYDSFLAAFLEKRARLG